MYIYVLQSLLFVKDNLNQIRFIEIRGSHHSHNTRHINLIDVNKVRLSKSQHNHVNNGITLFNKLPLSGRYVKCFKNTMIK